MANQENGLTYGDVTLKDIINKDTDGDGIPDWEETLWGTDPNKKETTPGIPDNVAIEKLQATQAAKNLSNNNTTTSQTPENMTETDKFSMQFFSTIASLNQNGALDQSTVDSLGSSLADQIKNAPPRKVFSSADIKIINDDSVQTIRTYATTLGNISPKTQIKYTVIDTLKKFISNQDNPNTSVLSQLDPNISQIKEFISGMTGMIVPESLAPLHLNLMNTFERIQENLSDIKLYDSDIIVAFHGISQYESNANAVLPLIDAIKNAINQKLK